MNVRISILLLWVSVSLCAGSTASMAEGGALGTYLEQQGYVSVPVSKGQAGQLYVEGKVNGETLKFMIDFSNEGLLFDIRRLRKLGLEFEKTDITIPTPRKTVRIETTQIAGLEFAGASTRRMAIFAGDVDAVYGISPGREGPDGVLGTVFLGSNGGMLDFSSMRLYLKLR